MASEGKIKLEIPEAGRGYLPASRSARNAAMALGLFTLVLALLFIRPLYDLAVFGAKTSLYSHVLLIPFISAYLAWLKRDALPHVGTGSLAAASVLLTAGVVILIGYWAARFQGWTPNPSEALPITILAFLCFWFGGFLLFLGWTMFRALAFPLAFLLFMVPFPNFVTHGLEVFFQHTSADAADLLLRLTGVPVFREGLFFKLPGITIEVAQECSGIRSSLVLFITSLIAGQMFLQSPWKRALLAFAVIPLAILRNGFRILTIAWLCVHVNPSMIESPIHHRGGPIFFALSLIPFFAFLIWLRRTERARTTSA